MRVYVSRILRRYVAVLGPLELVGDARSLGRPKRNRSLVLGRERGSQTAHHLTEGRAHVLFELRHPPVIAGAAYDADCCSQADAMELPGGVNVS